MSSRQIYRMIINDAVIAREAPKCGDPTVAIACKRGHVCLHGLPVDPSIMALSCV